MVGGAAPHLTVASPTIQDCTVKEKDMNTLNTRQKIAVLLMDLLLLAELTLCIYISYQDKDNMPYLFMQTYIPLCICTLVAFRILFRMLRDRTVGDEPVDHIKS